jgi:IS30 family transposase
LGRSQSTFSREIKRNTGLRGYRHKQANALAEQHHNNKPKAVKLADELMLLIDGYLRQDWSPEQIVGRLEKDGIIKLHHETIYRYILADKQTGGTLYKHLRHQNKTYRKREAIHGRSPRPHNLHANLCPAQEAVVAALRQTLAPALG